MGNIATALRVFISALLICSDGASPAAKCDASLLPDIEKRLKTPQLLDELNPPVGEGFTKPAGVTCRILEVEEGASIIYAAWLQHEGSGEPANELVVEPPKGGGGELAIRFYHVVEIGLIKEAPEEGSAHRVEAAPLSVEHWRQLFTALIEALKEAIRAHRLSEVAKARGNPGSLDGEVSHRKEVVGLTWRKGAVPPCFRSATTIGASLGTDSRAIEEGSDGLRIRLHLFVALGCAEAIKRIEAKRDVGSRTYRETRLMLRTRPNGAASSALGAISNIGPHHPPDHYGAQPSQAPQNAQPEADLIAVLAYTGNIEGYVEFTTCLEPKTFRQPACRTLPVWPPYTRARGNFYKIEGLYIGHYSDRKFWGLGAGSLLLSRAMAHLQSKAGKDARDVESALCKATKRGIIKMVRTAVRRRRAKFGVWLEDTHGGSLYSMFGKDYSEKGMKSFMFFPDELINTGVN